MEAVNPIATQGLQNLDALTLQNIQALQASGINAISLDNEFASINESSFFTDNSQVSQLATLNEVGELIEMSIEDAMRIQALLELISNAESPSEKQDKNLYTTIAMLLMIF